MTNEVSKDILYIGVDDIDIDLFESQYIVPEGMSYNSWVILDEKIAIMDTADARKEAEWTHNLAQALNGCTPDYLVCQHMEPDHSALVGKTMMQYPTLTLVCTAQTVKMLGHYFDHASFADRILVVKEGDTLSLGTHTLHFIAAPMVHWPEVMMTYESTEKILFAADGFGKFGALCNETGEWACEARRYYFNICGKYGVQVQNVLKKAATLDIQTIMPLHGPILQGEELAEAIHLYELWSHYEPETNGILIAYASIHGNTAQAAHRLAEILRQKGATKVAVSDLSRDDMAETIEDAFRYPKIICCASSYDAGVFPPMHDFLHHLQIKNFQRRRFALIENGSWAPTAAKIMRHMIESMKQCEIVEPSMTIWGKLKTSDLPALEALAEAVLKD
ncbi:MAG: FprA family A-type flavoprotein [Bacteroidaceae bacterium]|nr:FprA family A-type flavoprotein [Bacteroidaceae bacterium]